MRCSVLLILMTLGCGWLSEEPERRRDHDRSDHQTPAMRRAARAAAQELEPHVVVSPEALEPVSDEDMIAHLEALGYVDGIVEAADDRPSGVTVYERERTSGGWNFFTPAGHGIAVLTDMEGREVWRWSIRPTDVWPDLELAGKSNDGLTFRRALLLPDGDVIGLWSGYGIVRIDRLGRVKWANFLGVHHDLQLLPDGGVLTLTRKAHVVERIRRTPVLEDFLVWFGPEGRVVREFSLLEAFERYPGFDEIWRQKVREGDDLFHTNSVVTLGAGLAHLGDAFRPGNVLLSMRHLAAIAVVDVETESVVWHAQGGFRGQHDPRVVAPGRILIFDNKGTGEERSRLLELDLATRGISWRYAATKRRPFYTPDCGHAQRLDDGHTLINESAEGRAFEITSDGETVWEYRTPFRTGDAGDKVSRFYEFRRVPADADMSWLPTLPGPEEGERAVP